MLPFKPPIILGILILLFSMTLIQCQQKVENPEDKLLEYLTEIKDTLTKYKEAPDKAKEDIQTINKTYLVQLELSLKQISEKMEKMTDEEKSSYRKDNETKMDAVKKELVVLLDAYKEHPEILETISEIYKKMKFQ